MSIKWAVRTIRDGRVKIGGRWFIPSAQFMEYDGRLDGMRYAFGRYWNGDKEQPVVCLWGTEAAFCDEEDPLEGPGIVDGAMPWLWWHPRQDGGA